MELRQVRYFVAIAQAGSFGKAAEEQRVAKSALSKQIAALEGELGAKLFVRGKGRAGIELTEAGEAFLPQAVTMVQAEAEGVANVRRLGGAESGQVTMVVSGGWEAWEPWTELVKAFHEAHPGVVLKIKRAGGVEEICAAVSSGEADLGAATVIDVVTVAGLRIEELITEPVRIGLPPGHPKAANGTLELADLEDEQWLLIPVDRELVALLTTPLGFEPRIELEVPDKNTVRSLLMAGVGITALGDAEAPFFEGAEIRALAGDPATYSVVTVMRDSFASAATRNARAFLRGAFGLSD